MTEGPVDPYVEAVMPFDAILLLRKQMYEMWVEGNEQLSKLDHQSALIKNFVENWEQQVRNFPWTSLLPSYQSVPYEAIGIDRPGIRPEQVFRDAGATAVISPDITGGIERIMKRAQQAGREGAGRTFKGAYRRQAMGEIAQVRGIVADMRDAAAQLAKKRAARASKLEADAKELGMTSDAHLRSAVERSEAAIQYLPMAARPWYDPGWGAEELLPGAGGERGLYLGTHTPTRDDRLGPNAEFGTATTFPAFISLTGNLKFMHTADRRVEMAHLVESLLFRQLFAVTPGKLEFTIFDPTGLGQSVSTLLELAEYNPALVGGKIWSSTSDLQVQLNELTAHIELVIQKYLRSTYETIDQFNEAAGEIAEPYRTLVLFDFPAGFNEETFEELIRVINNGKRCGVRVIMVNNVDLPPPYGVNTSVSGEDLVVMSPWDRFGARDGGYEMILTLKPDSSALINPSTVGRIADLIGRKSLDESGASVRFDKTYKLFSEAARKGIRSDLPSEIANIDPENSDTWWAASTTSGIAAAIGLKGAREIAVLSFDSGDHAGALMVGRPGSGKSTMLHAFISGIATTYSPDELELYLIDFKEGVEFKMYASEALPHARCVAIESDREFGLSVLQSLNDELTRRGELLRGSGGRFSGLESLRKATGDQLPRILLIFDEFQVLFARNDKLGLAAADLLETLIRQGRGFGIHVLLGSQSLAGLDALGAHVPQLLPVRVLLAATESDAQRVLGEGNDAGKYLTTHGEGILNASGGAVEANERFKGILIEEEERLQRLRDLRSKAVEQGFSRLPIVFEGNAALQVETTTPAQFAEEIASSGKNPIRIRVGSPVTINGTADINLSREAGANVLLVARETAEGFHEDLGLPHAQLIVLLSSLSCSQATAEVVDFTSVDSGLENRLSPFVNRGMIRLSRRRQFKEAIQRVQKQVRERVSEDDTAAPPLLVVLFGVHRARDLDPAAMGIDTDSEVLDILEEILRDGPEVGVHSWVWCDTINGLSRRLSSGAVREFSWRVAGKMGADDSLSFLGTDTAAALRDHQMAICNDDLGIVRRCTAFSVPTEEWVESVLATSQPQP